LSLNSIQYNGVGGLLLLKETKMFKKRNYLDKIKIKKTSGKRSDVFSCFKEDVNLEKEKLVPSVFVQSKPGRSERRFLAVKRRFTDGKELTNRQIRRYVSLAKQFNEEVPPEVLKEYRIFHPYSGLTKKDRIIAKQKKQIRKYRKRVPKKYNVYIKSLSWEKRKNAFYKKFGRYCEICRSFDNIHLHHKFYGQFGFEQDEHLVALCQTHHKELHDFIGKTRKDMVEITNNFIKERAIFK
jgi:hypothetical protein